MNFFPNKHWESMSAEEQEYFLGLKRDVLVSRWESPEGETIKAKIVEQNLSGKGHVNYDGIVGTIAHDIGDSSPKYDLRGIDFSGYRKLYAEPPVGGFSFRDCSLLYGNFSDTHFAGSDFGGSDLRQCNFEYAHLSGCNFSKANLTFAVMDNAYLEHSDFRGAWIGYISLVDAELGYVRFNRKTDFSNIDIGRISSSSNPLFLSFVRRKHFLKHFRNQSLANKLLYYLWLIISDCGQSFTRWFFVSSLLCAIFGIIYTNISHCFNLPKDRIATDFTFYYYSVVTFTTLGFGDIVPTKLVSEIIVTVEVVLGYLMIGGLISIFATKFIPRD